MRYITSFVTRYERRLSTLAFVGGFIWDSLTLTRIDRLLDNLVLLSYLVIAFAAIMLINAHGAGKFQGSLGKRGVSFAEFLLPFSIGGLFSGFLIFYSRSGEVWASAPFLLILVVLFLGNEFMRRHYERFLFQMSLFFVALFSYAELIVPVLLGEMGNGVFILAGLVSVALFAVALRALSFVAHDEVERGRYKLWSLVGIIFVTFNFLYFNNMIPPIPLSLQEIGVYHSVDRTRSGEYQLSFEKAPWYAFGRKTSAVFHRSGSESVFVFSSVYAPTRLDTDIFHRWSSYNETAGEWETSSLIGFPISGGRSEGFRGYSRKDNIPVGTWRVDVETPRGQIIGRFVFTVVDATETPVLKEVTL
ncbi:MAG: DUF2914 domain-containing protein [bacterium]|nr:DUF2914 domain-containing protein [bacterium]